MRGMYCKWGVKKVEEVAVYICVVAMEGMKCVDVRRDRERKATHNDTKENKPNTKKRENKTKTKTHFVSGPNSLWASKKKGYWIIEQ